MINMIEESMVNTNNNHAIIKNRVSKNNHGINQNILKFLW